MFDSSQELMRQIRLGEDSRLELKTVTFRGDRVMGPGRDELADELAAMANTGEGVVVLGVDDVRREVQGIALGRLDSVETFVRQICNDSIKPPLPVRISRQELPDLLGEPQAVLRIDVPRSLFVHQSPGGYFQRIGSSRRPLHPEQLARLFQQRSQANVFRFDEQAVPGTTLASLDEKLWGRFLRPVTHESGESLTILRKARVLTLDDAGVERASVAGVLLASRHPEEWLSGAVIEAVAYRGGVRDANYQLDASRITGPLDQQVRDALHFVRRNMKVAAIKNPGRIEFPQYSLRAVFEALVNAVAHRDYSIHGSKIRLFMFADRLELFSPGALPNSMTVDSLELRQATRNELITSLLGRCRVDEAQDDVGRQYFLEKRGEGVPIILRESLKLSGREPSYRLIDDVELQLTVWAAEPPPPA